MSLFNDKTIQDIKDLKKEFIKQIKYKKSKTPCTFKLTDDQCTKVYEMATRSLFK